MKVGELYGLVFWMHPRDDVVRDKCPLGCLIQRTSKSAEQTLNEEWMVEKVEYAFQTNCFAKKDSCVFVFSTLFFVFSSIKVMEPVLAA